MIMNKLHINRPEVQIDTFRILPKGRNQFIVTVFDIFTDALTHGIETYDQGFKIFRQYTYEWYEPHNVEVAKIAEKKKWEKK